VQLLACGIAFPDRHRLAMEIGWRVLAGRRGEDRRRPEIRHTDPDPIPPGGAVLDPPNDQIQLIIAERLHQP